jgi:2'-5' RNA ligase
VGVVTRPIIAALHTDEESQKTFQDARDRWFPPRLNQVPAHLTLFHHLPGEDPEETASLVEEVCRSRGPFTLSAGKLVELGGGFAYALPSDELSAVRKAIAERFEGRLTRQDASGFRAHVTVQNKVTAETAKLCMAEHERGAEPFEVRAKGVKLWFYDGGPWEAFRTIPFAKNPDDPGDETPPSGRGKDA